MSAAEVKTEVEELLLKAGLDVDTSGFAKGYGTVGRVWVRSISYDRTDVYRLEAFCAVTPGQDIDALSDAVWAALDTEGLAPQTIEWAYGEPPLEGRDMPEADFAIISFVSCERY